MASHTIFVLDPYHEDAITLLQSTPNVTVVLPDDPRKADWQRQANGVLVRSETQIMAADFQAAAPRLRAIVKQGAGVDNVDLEAAKSAGVAVHNTPGVNAEAVAELTLALVLSLSRRVVELDRLIRGGETIVRSKVLGRSLFKRTVGIVGMGYIGRASAQKWIGACSADVIAYDPVASEDCWKGIPHRRAKELDDVLREADVVCLHVPLLPTTRGMIGARELGLMKEHAILANMARGGLVDEAALLTELRKGRLWGSVLDATETEPPTLDNYKEFLELGSVILTPHIGASTMENQSNSGLAAANELLGVLRGERDVPGKLV